VTLGGGHVDLLLHPPVPAIGAYDFKAGAALIETGYRHAAEALAGSGLPAGSIEFRCKRLLSRTGP
jgi:hypothetical protein